MPDYLRLEDGVLLRMDELGRLRPGFLCGIRQADRVRGLHDLRCQMGRSDAVLVGNRVGYADCSDDGAVGVLDRRGDCTDLRHIFTMSTA